MSYSKAKCPHGIPKFFWDTAQGWVDWNCSECLNAEFREIAKSLDVEEYVTSSTGGVKGKKKARFSLMPGKVLWALAEHFGVGAEKYDDRNWEKGYDWSLSFDALMRHAWAWWEGEDVDEETGSSHLMGVIFHAVALAFFSSNREKYGRFDDRRGS